MPRAVPDAQLGPPTRFPVIDTDPHAGRVVRYFRASDYATWAAVTAGFPGAMALWSRVDYMYTPHRARTFGLAGVLGFFGGFLLAYQNSSKRFWGWSENKREVERDYTEMRQRLQAGKPLYGEQNIPLTTLEVAANNSRYSQTLFALIPWFNLVNHPWHGTDPAKYEAKPEERKNV